MHMALQVTENEESKLESLINLKPLQKAPQQ